MCYNHSRKHLSQLRGERIMMIKTNIEYLRDPFIVLAGGVYYAYGTGVENDDWDNTVWTCYKNTTGQLDGEWVKVGAVAEMPKWATKNRWAPEVHFYKGAYYLFGTYYSERTGRKGCAVFKSSSPEGPFVEISDGHINPPDMECIDGTLYVDEDGTPWMVFVHEWNHTGDGVGRMCAAKMSADLTHFTSDVITLFRATDPVWAEKDSIVTDGCFMYKCKTGELLMIWSNFEPEGYCVGVARSDNGKVDGNWSQDSELLFSKALSGEYGGGHGMIFTALDGKQYMSVHSPNSPRPETGERTVFVPIIEENGRLITVFD